MTTGRTLDFLAEAVDRIKRGQRDAISWVWHQSMDAEDRAEFDRFLLRMKDPLMWEPGTPYSRFELRVKRMARLEKERVRTQGGSR